MFQIENTIGKYKMPLPVGKVLIELTRLKIITTSKMISLMEDYEQVNKKDSIKALK